MLHQAHLLIDAFLIYPYRMLEIPIFGFLLGSFWLAILCVLVGQFTLSVAFRANRKWLMGDNREMVRMHNLSVRALLAKDKNAYKACNKVANDAFGKVFFSQVALSISSLWPIPFALGWMQTRFADVDFALPVSLPLIGDAVGYSFSFIPLYILVYILFGKVKHRLPYFRNIGKWVREGEAESEPLIRFGDIGPQKATKQG